MATRDAFKEELNSLIDMAVPEDRELTDEDLAVLAGSLKMEQESINDINDDAEQNEDEDEAEEARSEQEG